MKTRPVSLAQIAGILAFSLALFFVIAFATKAVQAHALRSWLNRLRGETVEMERERAELRNEVERRRSTAWVDQALEEAGQIPSDVVSVIAVPSAPDPARRPAQAAAMPTAPPSQQKALIGNPNWQAWKRLILGFDREDDLYYNTEQ